MVQGGYGEPSLDGYYTKLSEAFRKFMAGAKRESSSSGYSPVLQFDGANGVGAQAMQQFTRRLAGVLDVTMHNSGR